MSKSINAGVLIHVVLCVLLGTSYIVNVMKLADCDFKAPYTCEVVHAVGIFPPAAVITVWFKDDSQ